MESIVTTKASAYGLGATLCQKREDEKNSVIIYASRTLTLTKNCHGQIETEALTVAWGCEKFRYYLT